MRLSGPGYSGAGAEKAHFGMPRHPVHDGRMPVHVERVELPGIGLRHDILTLDGRRLSVVSFATEGANSPSATKTIPDRADETIELTG